MRGAITFEGKRYWVSGKDKDEVKLNKRLREKELKEGKKQITKNMLVRDWSKEWLTTYKEDNVNSQWYADIKRMIDKRVLPEIGVYQIKNVKPASIKKIFNSCNHLSQSYVTKMYNILHEIFKDAKENDLILDNPVDSIKKNSLKSKPPTERRPITEKERKHILKVCEYHRAGLFLRLMLYCGLRPQEVVALKWKNVDLKNKILKVDIALKRDGSIGETKSMCGTRQVPIPDILIEDLGKHQGEVFDWVCPKVRGGHHTLSSIDRMWESFVIRLHQEMGGKMKDGKMQRPYMVAEDLVMYCLRHTYCTDLQDAGVLLNVAAELMGHADISTTAKIYTHKTETSFNNAAAQINKHISGDPDEEKEGTVAGGVAVVSLSK